MKPHSVLSVPSVRSSSRPRALMENTPNSWEMRNTFLKLSLTTRSQQTCLVIPT